MEPRPHERGNKKAFETFAKANPLQWSHVLTNVETAPWRFTKNRRRLLQWSHVLTNVETPAW